jgi:hypothetical protein
MDASTQSSLTKIWQWLAISALGLLLACTLLIAGGPTFLFEALENLPKPIVGYVGATVGGTLFFGSLVVAIVYGHNNLGEWQDRLPLAFVDAFGSSAIKKAYQAFMIFLLVLLPLYGVLHCLKTAEHGDICELDTLNYWGWEESNLFFIPSPQLKSDNQIRLIDDLDGKQLCEGSKVHGVELISFITPFFAWVIPVLDALLASTLLAMLITGRTLFLKKSR